MQQALLSGRTTNGANNIGFPLRDAIATLFRQKRLIIGVFVTVWAAVALVTFLLPNRYESRLKVLVKHTRADIIVSSEQIREQPSSNEVSEAQVNSEIELIRSRDLLATVAKKAGLATRFAQAGATDAPIAVEKAALQLEKDLRVAPVKKANIIEIKYQSLNPQTAAGVLQALGEVYLERHLDVHRVPGTDEFFKAQAINYEKRLKEAEAVLADYEKRHQIVALDTQKDLGLRRAAEAETEMHSAQTGASETEQRIKKIEGQLASLAPRITTQRRAVPYQASIQSLGTLLIELRNKRTQLLTRFRPEDRLVKEVEQQITETDAALQQARQQQSIEDTSDINPIRQSLELELTRAQAELSAKQARQAGFAQHVATFRNQLGALEATTLKHVELERKVKELQENYSTFVRKRDEALIANALDKQKISNVSIAEVPAVPTLPAGPNRPLHLLLGAFLAGFLSIGASLAAAFLRDTVHTPRELEAITDYPVLATIPHSKELAGKDQPTYLLKPGRED